MSQAIANSEPVIRRSITEEWSATISLFVLCLRQHTHGRRVYVLALLYLLPCVLAIVLRCVPHPATSEILEASIIFHLLPHGLAPLTALLYSSGVIQDEVEEQTLTYLLMRSVPRRTIYVTKMLATMCVTCALISLATIALYLAIYWGTPEFADGVFPGRMARAVAIMALAQVSYCSLFGFIGLLTRRSLIVGVAYIVTVEGILANINFVARSWTVVYYVRILILRWLGLPETTLNRFSRNWRLNLADVPSSRECVVTLLVFSFVVVLFSAFWFARREFRVKTPGE